MLDVQKTYLNHSAFPFPGLNAVYDFAESGTSKDVLQRACVRAFACLFQCPFGSTLCLC